MSPGPLLQIFDPAQGRGRAVGIDLGTTNSLVAIVPGGAGGPAGALTSNLPESDSLIESVSDVLTLTPDRRRPRPSRASTRPSR